MSKPSKSSLAEFSPRVAAMADGWDPSTVSSHSKKKLDWICSLGHTWQCAVGDMTAKNLGCPYCSGQRTLSGFNDLLTKFPEIAAQAHGWDPTTVAPRSSKKVEWKCKAGHISIAPVSSRTTGNGCPYCSGSKTLAGFNDLATTHPQLAAEAHGWDPHEYSKGSNYLAEWICKHGHVWKTSISERRSKNLGCPFCSGKRALAGFNDLATTHPQLAMEAHGWDPTIVTKGSRKVKGWQCDSGHVFQMKIQERTTRRLGCQFCSGKQVLKGFNDLVTTHPEIATRAHGWDPTIVTKGSKQIKEWKCDEGHFYKSQVQSQTKGGGCSVCSGHQIIIGSNDLATMEPGVAAQANGWDPTTITVSSGRKMPWICPLGHTWNATVASRSNHTSNCPTCSGKQVLNGFNDLATIEPDIAAQAHGWDPTTVTKGSKQIKKWKCEQDHVWTAVIHQRTGLDRTGCPSCASSGFDPNKPGFLYFVDHFDLHMFQIGITNFPDNRLNDHKRAGWEVIELRGPMDGQLTRQLETNCLHALEKRGAILGHKAGIEKFDGYSEAWTKASLNVSSIKQIMDWVYEDEVK
jgi:hypothetical protein